MGRKSREYQKNKGFKPGNKYGLGSRSSRSEISGDVEHLPNKWRPRMSAEDYDLAVRRPPGGGLSTPDSEGRCTGIHLLRPKPRNVDDQPTVKYLKGKGKGEMRIVQMDKCLDMFNICLTDHTKHGSACLLPQFAINKEVKKGVCWRMSLKCKNCDFIAKEFKLYDEAKSNKRGPKYAMPNLGLQVALQETPISNTQARLILACMNTPPPSHSSMHRTANKVGDMTTAAAEQDLQQECKKVRRSNRLRGLKESSGIKASFDGRYNSNSMGGRDKMGQNASQGIATCVEHQTEKKKIIGVSLTNKLCHKGALLRSKGSKVKCPGHKGCTATQNPILPLSEYEMGKEIGENLRKQEVSVRYCTTDGDARGAAGMSFAMAGNGTPLERQADPTHLGQSLYRHSVKADFSERIFPGTTKKARKKQQQMLSKDIKHRCHMVYTAMYEANAGDTAAIERKMPSVIDATIECYSGDCGLCKRHGIVCKGGKKNWLSKSKFLESCGATCLNPTAHDRRIIRGLLEFYLGKKALRLMKTNTNTNRNEAINRSISSGDPKNVNYSRNAKARLHASISRCNKGAGNSVIQSLEAVGAPVSKGGRVAKALHRRQIKSEYYKTRSQSSVAKHHRQRRKFAQLKEYMKESGGHECDYKQGQLDPEINLPALRRRSVRLDHPYGDN